MIILLALLFGGMIGFTTAAIMSVGAYEKGFKDGQGKYE